MSKINIPNKAKTVEHGTPSYIYEPLNREFEFTLDAAATKENAKCKTYFTKENSGLLNSWKGHTVWCNPPYDKKSLESFIKKSLYEAVKNNVTTVLLVPCKTDQE